MTYFDDETSIFEGQPIECFKFSITSPLATTIWRLTSADIAITLPDGVFTPEPVSRSRMTFKHEDHSGSVDVYLPLSHAIVALFSTIQPQWPLSVTIFRAHRGAESEFVTIFVGHVGTVMFGNEQATISCIPLSARLTMAIPTLSVQSQCVWNLYGVGCLVPRANFEVPATVASVSGVSVTAPAFATKPNGWFNNGYISEDATGVRRFIVNHVGDTVTLAIPFLPQLLIGAAIKGYAGCDRSEAVCEAKFNNLVNHLGFPRIPARNPHDDRAGGRRFIQRRAMTPREG